MPMRSRVVAVFSAASLMFALFSGPYALAHDKMTHEQQWIVDSIGKDIAGMVLFAAKQKGAIDVDLGAINLSTIEDGTNEDYSYLLRWNSANATLSSHLNLTDYVWSPSNYAPWAKQLLDRFHLQSANSAASTATGSNDLIAHLNDYDSERINKENKRVSTALTEHPLNADLHEQAALLCALMGLRECAGKQTDTRPEMNRITAHLSMAQALRGKADYGDAGKLAEATINALCGRTASCVALIGAMANNHSDEIVPSWLRALQMRATHDYRIADLAKAESLEQLEYGRAYASMVGTDELRRFTGSHKTHGADIDWWRLELNELNELNEAEPAPPGDQLHSLRKAEMADFVEDCKRHGVKNSNNFDEIASELNQKPTGCLVVQPSPQLQALSWPNLCAFHRRQLSCLKIQSAQPLPGPSADTQFVPKFPLGTAYDFDNRTHNNPNYYSLSLAELNQLRALCPYDDRLNRAWALANYGAANITGEELTQAYGNAADFDVHAMQNIGDAYRKEPLKYIAWLANYASFKPQTYFELGYAYAEHGELAKAVSAFENGVAKCEDPVTVSNNCQWLVDYYYDHGQKDKALDLAEAQANAKTARGVGTLAELYERMGNLEKAEEYYQKVKQDYGSWKELGMFYVRHRNSDEHCQQKAQEVVQEKFPEGLVKLDVTTLSNPPKIGVKMASASTRTEENHLKVGDIFVAVDGYRVQTDDQFYLARSFKLEPPIEFTVWDGQAYRVITANYPDRRLHCALENYHANQ